MYQWTYIKEELLMISTKLRTLLVFLNIRIPKGMRYDSKLSLSNLCICFDASCFISIKWKTKNTTPKEQFKNPIEKNRRKRSKIDTPNTQIHDRSLSSLGTDTSINSGGVKLVLWIQTSPLSVMMWTWTCMCSTCE
jgi:hypothetical protein